MKMPKTAFSAPKTPIRPKNKGKIGGFSVENGGISGEIGGFSGEIGVVSGSIGALSGQIRTPAGLATKYQ